MCIVEDTSRSLFSDHLLDKQQPKSVLRWLVLLTVSLLLPGRCRADTHASELLRRLDALSTFHAHYTQVTRVQGRILRRVHGQIWLERPGRIRLEPSDHSPIIVVDDDQAVTLDESLEQVTIQRLDKQTESAAPAVLLSDPSATLLNFYTVVKLSANGKVCAPHQLGYRLMPKQSSVLKDAVMCFEGADLVALQFEDQLGQLTQMTFSHLKPSTGFDQQTFHISIPKTYDVIDLTTRET